MADLLPGGRESGREPENIAREAAKLLIRHDTAGY
jgi:hypothetical protein